VADEVAARGTEVVDPGDDVAGQLDQAVRADIGRSACAP
jgi:hypothetical protein